MVRQDSLFDPVEERALEHDRKVEQAQERQKYADGVTQEINELKKRQHQEEYKILEQLLDDSVDLKDECTRVAKENKLSTYKSTKSFDENLTTNILFRSFLLAYVKKTYPDLFTETEAQFAIPIETLEQKLLAL